MQSSDAFRRLQPICVAVCRDRSVDSLTALRDAVDAISDDESIQRLQDYILFPLKLILKLPTLRQDDDANNKSNPAKVPLDQVIESSIRCVRTVLKRTTVNNIETAVELFTSLLGVLGHPKNGGRADAGVSEERKEIVVAAVETLVRNCDDDLRLQLCTVDFLPLWGHAVATFLSLAELESGSGVVVAALRALITIEESLPCDEASTCFSAFLPGIVVTCLKLSTRDEKQNHRVNCEALRLLTQSISLVLSDEDGRQSKRDEVWKRLSRPATSSSSSSSSKSSLLIEPTTEWRSQTWEKVGLVISKICQSSSSNHPHWKVRLEILTLIHCLITKCRREDYEKHCMSSLLEITVSRLNDDNADVRQLAAKVVERLQQIDDDDDETNDHGDGGGRKFLREAAVESLRQTTLKLPGVFRRANDDDKLRHVQAMKGYLAVLGKEGLQMALLSSPSLINKMLSAFLQVLEMDVEDLRIIQRLPSNTLNTFVDAAHESFKPRIQFTLFNDEKVSALIEDCLRMLGRFFKDDLFGLCDPLLESLQAEDVMDVSVDAGTGTGHEKQAVFILNQILLGSGEEEEDGEKKKKKTKKSRASTVIASFVRETLLPLYLSSSLLNAQCEPDPSAERAGIDYRTKSPSLSHSRFLIDSKTSISPFSSVVSSTTISKSLPKLNSNILLVSLCLEGVSYCAKTLKASFRPLLVKSLYPVVEKVASEITMIQDSAFAALKQMAVGCGVDSVGELLLRNSDYVVNNLRFELRHGFLLCDSRKSSDAPRVLSAMLKNAGPELLPMLKDTVEEVLDCLDTAGKHQPEHAKIFMIVLSALVFYVKQWFGGDESEAEEKRRRSSSSSETENSKEYWDEYVKNLTIVETLEVDENDDDEAEADAEYDEEAETPTPEDPPPPYHVRVTEEVMRRCIYHLPDENPRLRVLVLDIMQNCCLSLASHENALLPLAHQCWSSLVFRLKDKDRLVALKAFETLVVLSRTCGDFLLQRFSKDVVPALSGFMMSQGLVSAGLTVKSGKSAGLLLELFNDDDKKIRRKSAGENALGSGGAYRFTVAYKLQLAVLTGIGPLCRTIKFGVETGLDKVIDFLILHLRLSQPIELQDAAKDALVELGSVDSDLVWLRLSSLKGEFAEGCTAEGTASLKTSQPASVKLNDPLKPHHHRNLKDYSPNVLCDIIRTLSRDDDS